MRIAFIILGVLFLLVGGGLGIFLLSQYENVKNEEVPLPNVEQEPPKRPSQLLHVMLRGPTLAEAVEYQTDMQEYTAKLITYTQQKLQAEGAYQNAIKARDDKAGSYLLYLAISASAFGVLSFASFGFAALARGDGKQPEPGNEA